MYTTECYGPNPREIFKATLLIDIYTQYDPLLWSKTILITGGVRVAGVDPPTFIMRALFLGF